MRFRTLALAVVTFTLVAAAPAAGAVQAQILRAPAPSWLTPELRAQIHAAGAEGVQIAEEYLNTSCPGAHTGGVAANSCIVAPYGCTANFIFSDGSNWRTQPYLGTASHCADKVGDVIIAQVDTTTLAEIGTVARKTAEQEPGDDFALIKVFPEVAAKWGVTPAAPTGGPQGIYADCAAQTVKFYGHGYGVAVGPGKVEVGLAPFWYREGYGWYGSGFPGDSGSGVTLLDNRAAGDFTHIIVFDPDLFYTPGMLAGTRITAILEFLGGSYALVNADGSLSRSGAAPCEPSIEGGGGGDGGGNGGGKGGGGKPKGGS